MHEQEARNKIDKTNFKNSEYRQPLNLSTCAKENQENTIKTKKNSEKPSKTMKINAQIRKPKTKTDGRGDFDGGRMVRMTERQVEAGEEHVTSYIYFFRVFSIIIP